jgi:hypothetical protein
MTAVQFNVHDLIETPGHLAPRLYIVDGIHLGALGQENVIELSPVDKSDPDAHGKKQSMFVPMELLESGISSGLFTITTP